VQEPSSVAMLQMMSSALRRAVPLDTGVQHCRGLRRLLCSNTSMNGFHRKSDILYCQLKFEELEKTVAIIELFQEFPLITPRSHTRVVEVLKFLTSARGGSAWSAACPSDFYPNGRTPITH